MTIPALILAAGKGSRMGSPKALMRFGRSAWWRVQQARLALAQVHPIWIVSEAVAHEMHTDSPFDRVIASSEAPMFASILAGLDSLNVSDFTGVFILPIDVPASVDPALWTRLSGAPRPAVPAFQGRHGHPLFLPRMWITSVLEPAKAAAAAPRSLRLDTLVRPSLIALPVTDPCVVCNLNTPDDLRRFLAESPASDPNA